MTLFVSTTENNKSSTFIAVVTEPEPEPLVPDDILELVESILNVFVFSFGTLGLFTNVINIRVFAQQGIFSDSNTMCLFALAVSDFLGCLFLIPSTFCEIVKYAGHSGHLMSCKGLTTLLGNMPHVRMSRITCWLTVYIAVERCLCVLIPFKVKLLLKPKVAGIVITVIYIIPISSTIPLYLTFSVKWRFVAAYNSTVAILTGTKMGTEVAKYQGFIYNTVLSIAAAIIVTIATGLMLYKLRKLQKWRERTAYAGGNKDLSTGDKDSNSKQSASGKRDIELLKTVLFITILFLICLAMSLMPGFAAYIVPDFSPVGKNKNLNALSFLYKFVFDVINSSLNYFFYIRTSSRYKTSYNEVFGGRIE